MKIVIETAQPILTHVLDAKMFDYRVNRWNVTGYTWDGNCMCTKKSFRLTIDWPFLDCSKKTMENMINKKLLL